MNKQHAKYLHSEFGPLLFDIAESLGICSQQVRGGGGPHAAIVSEDTERGQLVLLFTSNKSFQGNKSVQN